MRVRAPGANLPPTAAGTSDPLESIIPLLRPRVVVSKIVSGAGDWSIRKPRYADPSFCLVLEGTCSLNPDGIGELQLSKGDFLLLPETPGFILASDPGIAPTPLDIDHSHESHHGAEGAVTMRLLGGYFRFDRANAGLLVKLLPPTVLIRRDEPGAARIRRIVELITEETLTRHPCRELILERLVEVLLIEALRFRPSCAAAGERGLIAGLADSALADALRAIHADVARGWTVEQLARTAGMSRAVFAERFARTIGIPPMQYLLEWRVALAKEMLRGERPSLAMIAQRVGYQSASAFTTAFTRVAGCSPSEFARSTFRSD